MGGSLEVLRTFPLIVPSRKESVLRSLHFSTLIRNLFENPFRTYGSRSGGVVDRLKVSVALKYHLVGCEPWYSPKNNVV